MTLYRVYANIYTMTIRPKSPYTLEAQLGDYMLHGDVPGGFSFGKMGVTVGQLLEHGDRAFGTEAFRDANPMVNDDDMREFPDNYHAHLRELTPERREILGGVATLLETYDTSFMNTVAAGNYHPNWFMGGSFSDAQRFTMGDTDYVVRRPRRGSLQESNKHLEASLRVHDVPNIEHVVAASYTDNLTVAEFVPGSLLPKLTHKVLRAIPQHAYDELYKNLIIAESRGVAFDRTGNNILYDPETETMTMLDIAPEADGINGSAAAAFYANIRNTFPRIFFAGIRNLEDVQSVKTQIHMLGCLRNTLQANNPNDVFVDKITSRIEELDSALEHYRSL